MLSCKDCANYSVCGLPYSVRTSEKCLDFRDNLKSVGIVRCKDCRFFDPDENIMPQSGTCEYHEMVKMFWDFCSRGKMEAIK